MLKNKLSNKLWNFVCLAVFQHNTWKCNCYMKFLHLYYSMQSFQSKRSEECQERWQWYIPSMGDHNDNWVHSDPRSWVGNKHLPDEKNCWTWNKACQHYNRFVNYVSHKRTEILLEVSLNRSLHHSDSYD